jgi:hypothetical protein
MSAPVVLVDVDGVLAEFNGRFLALLNHCNGDTRLGYPGGLPAPDRWSWFEPAGFPKKAISEAWDFVREQPEWWGNLPAYPGTREFLSELELLRDQDRIVPYFCTTRPGAGVADETHGWLVFQGFERPNVVVTKTGTKALVAQAVGADAILDDYQENFNGMPAGVRCYLLDRPWNQEATGFLRIQRRESFLEAEACLEELRTYAPKEAA